VIGYRKNVILTNLRKSFPEKSEVEIQNIAVGFYKHFCDSMLETVKTNKMSLNTLNKRFRFQNKEIFDDLHQKGKSTILVSGHYSNWEWMVVFAKHVSQKVLILYKPLENEFFNDYMFNMRTRLGDILIPMETYYRRLMEYQQKGDVTISYFLADQTPPRNSQYWTTFLNQDTAFFLGPEKTARKTNYAVVFMNIMKVKRGYYEVEFIKLFDDTSNLAEFSITEAYARILEKQIQQEPRYWLWSHRRWKHKKPEGI
jgi:KDO2-lipid IV(A) lauroyltransferase